MIHPSDEWYQSHEHSQLRHKMSNTQSLIPAERIERSILLIRGQKVMLDNDLASLYGVETTNSASSGKTKHRAISRKISCFNSLGRS